ncbi:hypothetical protein DL95DRAFT_419168 [Leptodontidium sp. 2 PMI_412]|nr:hypothetical protein DL95DRAFT_419168 [Leptodontidium sp. 2 PMI_412]
MPARIWGSGIQPCFELLRGHLPASRDHVQSIFSYAYAMVALRYEAGHSFEGTWIKYLGKLAEFRQEIEDNGHDREVWTNVGWYWHSKALGIKTGSENPGPLVVRDVQDDGDKVEKSILAEVITNTLHYIEIVDLLSIFISRECPSTLKIVKVEGTDVLESS